MIPIRCATAIPVRSIPIRFKAEDFEPAWVTPESKTEETTFPRKPDWLDKFVDSVVQTHVYQFLDQKIFPKTLYPTLEWLWNRHEIGFTLSYRKAPRFLFFGKVRNTVGYPHPDEVQSNPELEKIWRIKSAQEDNRCLVSNTFYFCFWIVFGSQALVEATKTLSSLKERWEPLQPVTLSKLDRFFLKHAFKIDPDSLPQPEETPPTEDVTS